jgi:hypothetical protein
VIARDGIARATIRAIAREANCSRGILALRELQHAEFDRFADRLRTHLAEAEKHGELRDGVDIALAAHQLLVLIDGLSAERVLYPDRVTPARQQQMLDELLARLHA